MYKTISSLASVLGLVLVFGLVGPTSQAAPFTLTQTIDNPTPTSGDLFGSSVSISGNNMLVGSILGSGSGQAHLYNATTGALLQTFDDPTPTGNDLFGLSVSVSGNHALIGASADDTQGVNVGQAHLYNATTGALLQTFNDPNVTTNDQFGGSVSVSGNNVLIGARRDDTNGLDVGQAHLFDATTGALLQTFNDPTPTGGDQFGRSVSISGNNVLVGAVSDNTNGPGVGQAHLFDATTGALLQTFNDPTPTGADSFGSSVAISGNFALVGARHDDTSGVDVGQAYLFDATTGALLHTFSDPTPTGLDNFGVSVAIDGTNVLIGAFGDDTNGGGVGQAYLFDALTGALLQTIDDPTPTTSDEFGVSVSISGNNLLIGGRGDDTSGVDVGQAHLFTASVVSEPGALAIFGIGLIGLMLRRRNRKIP
ncbi:MAG: PEP-CTERM sorting domain-containing protein [Alphaproteobacteria bacterium]|nr:PEP-CTERM sorting domain-containing protein [Alphaproteobacteria bacterium]